MKINVAVAQPMLSLQRSIPMSQYHQTFTYQTVLPWYHIRYLKILTIKETMSG